MNKTIQHSGSCCITAPIPHKLAVFYHCRLSGGKNFGVGASINPDVGRRLFQDQIKTVVDSGLYSAADEFVIGVNGNEDCWTLINETVPSSDGQLVLYHGEKSESLLPTMRFLQEWLPGHEDWAVCFFHSKGVTQPDNALYTAWRGCMERCVIWNWRQCVEDLQNGYDMAGAHWLAREQFGTVINPEHGGTPFWGGAFWWAKSSYLITLPKLITEVKTREDWFWPEHWPGTGANPNVKDYAPHWPGLPQCAENMPQFRK